MTPTGEHELSIDLKCKKCVPPERHPGCHDDCEWYQAWKKEWEEAKNKERNIIWLRYLGMKDR
jgi:hypothetical protein